MATYSVNRCKHSTLIVGVVDTINLAEAFSYVRVTNKSNVGVLYVRTDSINPTVAGDDTFAVQENSEKNIIVPDISAIQVRIISSVAAQYSVEGYS